MTHVKISFNGEIRRYVLEPSCSLNDLKKKALALFSPQLDGKDISFRYQDDEDDWVQVSSECELEESFVIFREKSQKIAKFEIVVIKSVDVPPPHSSGSSFNDSVHVGITCDGCSQHPIVGVRYKCSVRHDFDLCGGCESRSPHPHPMIKIYHPNQAPAAIFVAVNEGPSHMPHHMYMPHHMPPHMAEHMSHHMAHLHSHGPHPRGPSPDFHHGPHSRGRGPCHGRRSANEEGHEKPHCGKGRRQGGCPLRRPDEFVEGLVTKAMNSLFGQGEIKKNSDQRHGCSNPSVYVNVHSEVKSGSDTTCGAKSDPKASEPTASGAGPSAADLDKMEQKQIDDAIRASLEFIATSHDDDGDSDDDSQMAYEYKEPPKFESASQSFLHQQSNTAPVVVGVTIDQTEGATLPPVAAIFAVPLPIPVIKENGASAFLSSRFLTRPDKAQVKAGKAWPQTLLIRNDGTIPWPAGTTIEAETDFGTFSWSLPAIQYQVTVDAVVKVDIEMLVPVTAVSGSVARFSLVSAGECFGDTLIVEFVTDEQNSKEIEDWQLLSTSPLESSSWAGSLASSTASQSATIDTSASTASIALHAVTETGNSQSQSAKSIANATWSRIWSAELEILAEMGFTNSEMIFPILQRYIDVPMSLRAGADTAAPPPNLDGIQDVVMHLLLNQSRDVDGVL